MQTNYNTCFETLVTVNNWQLSQQSCYLLITHQSHDHSDHLEKDLCNIPPIPLKLPLFGPPPIPSEFLSPCEGGGGMDIFWKYTLHLWKGGKRVKILQAKATFLEDRSYTKYKCKSQGVSLQGAHWLLIQYIEVHSLFVKIIFPE